MTGPRQRAALVALVRLSTMQNALVDSGDNRKKMPQLGHRD
jgi:hypothetical protein